jgi:hypothetical protein
LGVPITFPSLKNIDCHFIDANMLKRLESCVGHSSICPFQLLLRKLEKNKKKLQRKRKKEISYGEAFETLRRRGAQVNDLKIFVLAH